MLAEDIHQFGLPIFDLDPFVFEFGFQLAAALFIGRDFFV